MPTFLKYVGIMYMREAITYKSLYVEILCVFFELNILTVICFLPGELDLLVRFPHFHLSTYL